jgi:hypothetical protein
VLESLIKYLERYSNLEDSIEVERFDATLSQIASVNDPKAIGLLLPFFHDECLFQEAMFSIIHTIEQFDNDIYVSEILKGLPELWKKSPYWANVIHFRIFNHEATRLIYQKQLLQANPFTKAAAKALLITMRDEKPKFHDICSEMLAVLHASE